VHDLFSSLYSDREEQSRLNVVDAEGRIIFGPPLSSGGVIIGRPFRTTLYKWWLNATILAAEDLGTAVARRRILEQVMVALSIAVVIAGLIVVFVAAARERHLSNLKSDFVANVSHELKTPLSVVRMFGELLQSGRVESPEKQRQYLQIINTESERLTGLIENLLDFARAERGRASYNFGEGSIESVVERAVEACRPRSERTEIEVDVPDDLPPAWIDERAVEIALINLIDNALKYAPDGRRVLVSVRNASRWVEFRVTDEGPGISAEERRRVFERFFRGRSAEVTKSRGSGIGLSLVQHIANAHGGRAWVESGTTGGSTVVFSIRSGARTKPPEPLARPR
jgi:two-component system phosphate regulon sensor histidine kinase PhoR